jgi:PERQ amino acid-rich with GYF domain-containing protein
LLICVLVDEFVNDLCNFPPESGIIADAVYSNSPLMDGRRFADEFLRRKKLADKGVIEAAGSGGLSFATGSGSSGSGGWSEVAKKGPVKEPEPAAGFKVVPNKKKGRK